MSDWEQVDVWRDLHALPPVASATPKGEWRAFAWLVPIDVTEGYERSSCTIRVRGREGDKRLKFERPCHFVPGKWRSLGFSPLRALGLDKRLRFLPEAALQALLVAFDEWQEKGAPRRSRPVEIAYTRRPEVKP